MSQVVEKEGILEFFKQLFEKTKDVEDIEEMTPGEEIDETTLKELQKSMQEVDTMAKQYSIEKFEVAQKSSKIKKAEMGKTAKQQKLATAKKEQEQQQEKEQGESR